MKPFLYTALAVNAVVLVLGVGLTTVEGLSPLESTGIALAVALQATVFLLAGFPAARQAVESRFKPVQLAAILAGATILPYLLYAPATGHFRWNSFAIIAPTAVVLAFWYVVFPVRGDGLRWQDVVFVAAIAYPQMMSRTFPILQQLYTGPSPLERMDFLAKLGLFSLGAFAMLSIRRLPRVTYEIPLRRRDWPGGLLYAAAFLPIGVGLALWLGYVRIGNNFAESLPVATAVGLVLANGVGIYLGVSLPEEMLFRGILQNLLGATFRSRWAALVVAAALFGLAHWPRRYPDWRFALLAGVAGVFYGLAYMRNQRVPEAALAHTLVVLTQRFAFT